jgi:hypothetical protein
MQQGRNWCLQDLHRSQKKHDSLIQTTLMVVVFALDKRSLADIVAY